MAAPTKKQQIMLDFIEGEIDVLVSTTIIETGLDISNANTMIIHEADKPGLSQLYQLRGREAGIVVGTHTALLDNPSLSIRNTEGKQPTRILIDRELKVPFTYQLYNSTSPTIVFTEKETIFCVPLMLLKYF